MELIDLLFHHVRESIDLKGPLVIQYSDVFGCRGRAIRLTAGWRRSGSLFVVPLSGKIRFVMFNPSNNIMLEHSEDWIGPTLYMTDPNCLEEVTIFVYEFFGVHNFFGVR